VLRQQADEVGGRDDEGRRQKIRRGHDDAP
jgi:hypothetical protein